MSQVKLEANYPRQFNFVINSLSKIWLSAASCFEPVQYLFNGDFWAVFIKKFGKFEKKRVLDLACGTGEINKFIKPDHYTGIDINKFYIDYAKNKFRDQNISFVHGDIVNLKKVSKVDIAILVSASHHLSDEQMLLVLKSLKVHKIKKLLLVDAVPQGWISEILKWLDANLGGGKHFRSMIEAEKLVSKIAKVEKKAEFSAKRSFYLYFFLLIQI